MAKVPVGKTIAFSYLFTFGRIGTIIGKIWLPMLLLTLGSYFVISPYYESFSLAVAQDNTAVVEQAAGTLFLYLLVSLIFYAMIYVALTREALGLSQSHSFFHFSLGTAEWRMYGAILAFAFVFLLISLLVFLGAFFLGGVLSAALGGGVKAGEPNPTAVLIGRLVFLGIICVLAYIFVRLFSLLAPVTVAEEQISLGRGWQLTAKNFWRLVVVIVATLGPVLLVGAVCEALIIGEDVVPAHADPSFADMAARMEQMRPHLPAIYGLYFVLSPFLYGLMLGASAFAYRTLVPGPAARNAMADVP